MSENKAVVEKYMEGFRRSDHEMILSCLTDDVVWLMPGNFNLSGKQAFDNEIENPNFTGKPIISVSRMVEEDDVVIAEGGVQAQMANGDKLDAVFCDVFELENGKIKKLTSYMMNK